MQSQLQTAEPPAADRFPNKQVIVRDLSWPRATLEAQYHCEWETCRGWTAREAVARCIKPNIVLVKPPEMTLFLETNAHGFLGPELDFGRKLVGVWGDSVVEGWGLGWIHGESELLPGYQVVNGGVGGATLPFIGQRAIEMNRRLPFTYNLVFPGLNSIFAPVSARSTIYFWLHRLLDRLPNVILCTQPTSLNEDLLASDLTSWLATGSALGYHAGYNFWMELPPTREYVQAMFEVIVAQNAIVRQVAQEREQMRGQRVPVLDFYQRFYTRGAPDFRTAFVDAGHFRVEAYPMVWQALCEELAGIVA
jgi:hypothetical protein